MPARPPSPSSRFTRRVARGLFVWALVWSVVIAIPRAPRVAPDEAAHESTVASLAAVSVAPSREPAVDLGDALPDNVPWKNESSEGTSHPSDGESQETIEVGMPRRAAPCSRAETARRVVERLRATRRVEARTSLPALSLDRSLAGCRGTASHLRC